MIRTGEQYRESLRDGRQVWINGEKVKDVTTHPSFKPIVDVRARIYDMAHDAKTRDVMSYVEKDRTSPAASATSCRTRRRTGRPSGAPSIP